VALTGSNFLPSIIEIGALKPSAKPLLNQDVEFSLGSSGLCVTVPKITSLGSEGEFFRSSRRRLHKRKCRVIRGNNSKSLWASQGLFNKGI